MSTGDGTDEEASLSTARTVSAMHTSPGRTTKGDVFNGLAEARSVCPFCGKPASKSALSSHLLVCQKRKESLGRIHAPVMSQSQKMTTARPSSVTTTHDRAGGQQQQSSVDRLSRTATYSSRAHSASAIGSAKKSSPLVKRGRNERSVIICSILLHSRIVNCGFFV